MTDTKFVSGFLRIKNGELFLLGRRGLPGAGPPGRRWGVLHGGLGLVGLANPVLVDRVLQLKPSRFCLQTCRKEHVTVYLSLADERRSTVEAELWLLSWLLLTQSFAIPLAILRVNSKVPSPIPNVVVGSGVAIVIRNRND